jgi:hypothetical protein
MTLHFFAIPALTPQPAQDEFNRFLPELDEQGVAETTLTMDQTSHPVRLGQFPVDKPQGTRSAGRQVRGSNPAENASGCRLFSFAE